MEPAHPELCHSGMATSSPLGQSAAAWGVEGCMGAGRECASFHQVCLYLLHQFLQMLHLAHQRGQLGPSVGGLGRRADVPRRNRPLRCREGSELYPGTSSSLAELQAGGQARSFRSMDGLLELIQTLHTPFAD